MYAMMELNLEKIFNYKNNFHESFIIKIYFTILRIFYYNMKWNPFEMQFSWGLTYIDAFFTDINVF